MTRRFRYIYHKICVTLLYEGEASTNIKFLKRTTSCADRERGGAGEPDPQALKNHKIGFLSNTGQDPLKNHKAAKPAFNVGPSTARQRNTILWRFCGGPMMVHL